MSLPKHLVGPLNTRFRAHLTNIAAAGAPKLVAAWHSLDRHDREQIAEFQRLAHPIVTTAKTATVAVASGYYSLIAGVPPPSIGPDHVDIEPDLEGPFFQSWKTLSLTGDVQAALLAGANRAAATIENLVASTARLTADPVYERRGVLVQAWYREPEADACDWCVEMATNPYSSADAADFGHDRCACTVSPQF